jgi:hypothetical protein
MLYQCCCVSAATLTRPWIFTRWATKAGANNIDNGLRRVVKGQIRPKSLECDRCLVVREIVTVLALLMGVTF